MINDLEPKGSVWEPEEDGDLDLLLEGMGDNYEVIRTFLSQLSDLRNPNKTIILADLEREFGFPFNSNISEATRRQRLAELVYNKNGNGTDDDLETALQNSGFDVHVYQNSPAVDPAIFISGGFAMWAGGETGYAGMSGAFASKSIGELLVNGDIFSTEKVYDSLSGAMWSGDGFSGSYITSQSEKKVYDIPTDPKYWPFVFFVGGAATYDFIDLLLNGGFEFGNFDEWTQNNATLEGYPGYTQWAATTAYVLGDFRVPTVNNGFKYEVTVAGTSGGAEPIWPTTPGNTVVDGTVTWTCRAFNVSSGEYASRLEATGANTDGAEGVSYDINPFHSYTVKAQNEVNAYTAGNYRNVLEFRDSDDMLISTITLLTKTAVTSGYEQTTKTIGRAGAGQDFDIPLTAAKIRIKQLWDGTPTGIAYMDDVEFYRSDEQSLTGINFAEIDAARESEFKSLILKYKPLYTWAALIVYYA